MNGLVMIFYVVSMCLCSFCFAESIAYNIFSQSRQSRWLIVLLSCILFTLSLGFANLLTLTFLQKKAHIVINFVFSIMQYAMVGFLIVVIPYLVYSFVARSWRKKERIIFYSIGILFFLSGLGLRIARLTDVINIMLPVMISLPFIFCLVTSWLNLKNIQDKGARGFCISMNIVAMCLIPLCILAIIFPDVKTFSYPFYVMPFFVVFIVYFHCQLKIQSDKITNHPVLTRESLERYRISDREFSVVELITEGLTNKEIASDLCISVNTVNNHVANIFDKMGVRSRIDLLKLLQKGPWA